MTHKGIEIVSHLHDLGLCSVCIFRLIFLHEIILGQSTEYSLLINLLCFFRLSQVHEEFSGPHFFDKLRLWFGKSKLFLVYISLTRVDLIHELLLYGSWFLHCYNTVYSCWILKRLLTLSGGQVLFLYTIGLDLFQMLLRSDSSEGLVFVYLWVVGNVPRRLNGVLSLPELRHNVIVWLFS